MKLGNYLHESSQNGRRRVSFSYCRAGTTIASLRKTFKMKKILIGALVCAAVAGVVYYLSDPEQFNDTVGDLKKKATDTFDKVKDGLGKAQRTATENV
jgi:hypothetical protein